MSDTLKFQAEIKKVEAKKLASLDVAYTVTLYTDNPNVQSLGTLSGDTLVNVEVNIDG